MKTIKRIIFSISLLLFLQYASATINATTDRSTIEIGQSFTLTIDISGQSDTPEIDVLKNNFDVYGTSSSSQMSIVNGHTSSQKSFIINLSPKNTGKQLIPPIKVGNDSTSPIQINVVEPSKIEKAEQDSKAFVEASLSNKTGYVGVPVVLSVKLYYSVQLANVNMDRLNIQDAQLQTSGKESRYTATLNGTNYEVIEQKFLLTPQKAGSLMIPSVKITGGIMENDANNFLPIVAPRPFTITSKPINLKVNSVPSGIAPKNWLPAKKLELNDNWSVQTSSVKIGQPITRTITLEATGILDSSIPELNFKTPNGLNSYPDKTVSSNSVNGDELIAKKVFKVAYVPTIAGTIEFPEIKVQWWDITTNSPKIAIIPAKTFSILNENVTVVNKPILPASNPIVEIKQDEPKNKVQINDSSIVKPIWFYISIIMTFLWLITLLICIILYRKSTKTKAIIATEPELNTGNEKRALAMVAKACKDRDLKSLNLALIQWGSSYFKKTIYTVLDIKDICTNKELNLILDNLNLAIYRGQEFSDYENLFLEIEKLSQAKKHSSQSSLKELYPK